MHCIFPAEQGIGGDGFPPDCAHHHLRNGSSGCYYAHGNARRPPKVRLAPGGPRVMKTRTIPSL